MGIGPSSKETTLHHCRDPLVETLCKDRQINFLGILVQGTPEVIRQKQFVAERTVETAKALGVKGAIVSIDSWGNSHVDFTSVLQNLGKAEIPTVGYSFVGNQASFVVTNSYMDLILDMNKNDLGIETTVVGQNTANEQDAIKGVTLLKHRMQKKYGKWNIDDQVCEIKKMLTVETVPVETAMFSDHTELLNGKLQICRETMLLFAKNYPHIEKVELKIIEPSQRQILINTILDFFPIGVKTEGSAGYGRTRRLSGICAMVTAAESGGFQPSNIGSSEGILESQVAWGRRGTPKHTDWIFHMDVTLSEGAGRTREGIQEAHAFSDQCIQEIRGVLKNTIFLEQPLGTIEAIEEIQRSKMPGVVLIKLVSGLGCMYDTGLFPKEFCGYLGSRSIMDMGNMPVFISSNEYLDGVIRSLT